MPTLCWPQERRERTARSQPAAAATRSPDPRNPCSRCRACEAAKRPAGPCLTVSRQPSAGRKNAASVSLVRSLRQRLHEAPIPAIPVAAAEPARLRKGPQGLAWRSFANPLLAARTPRACRSFAACGSGYTERDRAWIALGHSGVSV
ncbi:hypothetical protein DWF74_28795 [Pseudomonas protegens]|nr:hypothetical protein DWF74_28795 [Pseudomonas protegens]